MSPRLPRLTSADVIRALRRKGWFIDRIHGSHIYLKHPDYSGMRVTVAAHAGETIKPKTLQSILKQAGLDTDEFIELL